MFHHVRGVPFDFNSGAFDNLNMWEQIDNGAQYTPTKKFLLSVPIVLFLLSTHYTHYDLAYFVINFLAVLGVIIPKLPFVGGWVQRSIPRMANASVCFRDDAIANTLTEPQDAIWPIFGRAGRIGLRGAVKGCWRVLSLPPTVEASDTACPEHEEEMTKFLDFVPSSTSRACPFISSLSTCVCFYFTSFSDSSRGQKNWISFSVLTLLCQRFRDQGLGLPPHASSAGRHDDEDITRETQLA